MRGYIDLRTFVFQRRLSGYPVESVVTKHGAIVPLEIQFVRDCVVVDLEGDPSLALSTETGDILTDESGNSLIVESPAGIFGLKAPGSYDGASYVVAGAWQKTGEGTSALYTFNPSYTGVALDSLLSPNAEYAQLVGELRWSLGSSVYKTLNQFEVVVNNSVCRGTEAAAQETARKISCAVAGFGSVTFWSLCIASNIVSVVLGGGLEPPCLAAYAPQTYVSAISPPERMEAAI